MYDWQNKTILVVDDDRDFCFIIQLMLKKTKANLIITHAADECLEFIQDPVKSRLVDLIILDIQMPNVSGYDTVGLIRNINKTVPLMALTAFGMRGERQKCLDIGFTEYLAKPFEDSILFSIIENLLQRSPDGETNS